MASYKTLKGISEGFYKSKGSKFIGYACAVYTSDEIKDFLEKIKSKHPKAGHHCYAWRLGMSDDRYRMNDDGEPSGTAGKPIFGQIRSQELRNVIIVIVRHFGGTKLGVAGLISAYKSCAAETLAQAEIVSKDIMAYYRVEFSYEIMNEVMAMLKRLKVKIDKQKFEGSCEIELSVKQADRENLILVLEKLDGLRYEHLYTA